MTLRRLLPVLAFAAALGAHPMGNFSVNHYTRVEVSGRGVAVTYALDLAEIPTFELLREWKLDAKGPREALQARAVEQAREWVKNVEFRAGGVRVQPKFLAADLALAEGAGGLAVGRITARLELPPGQGRLEFEDHNYAGRAGWKEIVIAAGEGARLVQASHGSTDRSKALTEYPAEPAIKRQNRARSWTMRFPGCAHTPLLALYQFGQGWRDVDGRCRHRQPASPHPSPHREDFLGGGRRRLVPWPY